MTWIYGINPIQSMIEDSAGQIKEVWHVRTRKPNPGRERVVMLAEGKGIRVRLVDEKQLLSVVDEGVHQGVAARIEEFQYADAEGLAARTGPSLIFVIDGAEDPRNLGAVLRSACAFGACGVVIPKHHSASVTPATIKASAGAASRLPVARVTNIATYLEVLKKAGFWVYGAAAGEGTRVGDLVFDDRTAIVVGSEHRGLRTLVRERCDFVVSIPTQGVESLNLSVAAAILGWEWARGRAGHKIP